MCGIAGFFAPSGLSPALRDRAEPALDAMASRLTHRGPDGAGRYLDLEAGIGLAHRRLSIVDVEGGAQPLGNEDGRVRVIFNGEIYNHALLRPGLEARGHRLRTRADTEVLVHLYEDHGAGFVPQLRGMFAFALWDAAARRLLLARDRLGIKPLYVAWCDGVFLFASELRSLLAWPGVERELEPSSLARFLTFRCAPGEQTLLRGIRRVQPGRTVTVDAGGERGEVYWRLEDIVRDPPRCRTLDEAADLVLTELEESVRLRLMSDVPLGTYLSGGVDSSLVTAFAARHHEGRLATYTVGFQEEGFNEFEHARAVSRAYGTDHHELVLTTSDYVGFLPKYVVSCDDPVADPSALALYFISNTARADGVKVMLAGEGADEVFSGYQQHALHQRVFRNPVLHALLRTPRSLRRGAHDAWARLLPSGPWEQWLRAFAVMEARYRGAAASFDLMDLDTYLRDVGRGEEDPIGGVLARFDGLPDLDPLNRMLLVDLAARIPDDLLTRTDRMSMAASIEARVPFLDHVFLEKTFALPAAFKIQGALTKRVLKHAAYRLVPRSNIDRPKVAFHVPVAAWMRGPIRDLVEGVFEAPSVLDRHLRREPVRRLWQSHQAGADHAIALWRLFILKLWCRTHLDGAGAA